LNGREGFIGTAQAEEAARALAQMPQAQYDKIAEALSKAGSGAEQALILKAVAARSDVLTGSQAGARNTAQGEVLGFADDIRGLSHEQLVAATTVIDVDASKDTSSVNPLDLLGKKTDDHAANDDGLFQHLTQSCAPTTAEMLRSEADPVYALSLTRGGLSTIDPKNVVTKGQQDALDTHGGVAIDRMSEQKYLDTRNTMIREAKTNGVLTEPEADVLWKQLTNVPMTDAEALQATGYLARLRAANGGAPSDEDVKKWQELEAVQQKGTNAPVVISDMTQVATHERLTEISTKTGANNSKTVAALLPKVAERLREGRDVPLGVGSDDGKVGHVMLITDVRGTGADQAFLISDPSSGRTDWVKGTDLANSGTSKWMQNQFNVDHQEVTGFLLN
jgi:hypothetical protein